MPSDPSKLLASAEDVEHAFYDAIARADLDSLIDRAAEQMPADDLVLRRLKKRRLLLRDQIARLEAELDPPEPA